MPDPSPRTSFRTLVAAVDRLYVVLDASVRLPTAMFPLGLLLYVADRTGSYATGGLAVAALSIGGGVGGALVGLAADRFGQRQVVVPATSLQVLALGGLLLLHGTEPLPLTLALAALLGLANPQAGAMARARWGHLARGRADRPTFVSTAMAFEGALDETSFVVGPVLVSTVAGLTTPTYGLVLALLLAALTQLGFGWHPSALPARGTTHHQHPHGVGVPWGLLASLLVSAASIGLVFGATQTGVAAHLGDAGQRALTGPVYAAMGVGSALTALLTTRLPRTIGLAQRIAVSGVLLALAGLFTARVSGPAPLALGCLLLGVALAPALISSYALAERAAPAGWATTTMTALATANVVGVAAGAAVAGGLVDSASPAAALLVDCVAGALVALAGGSALALGRRGRGPSAEGAVAS